MRDAIMAKCKAYSWPWNYAGAINHVVEAMNMYLTSSPVIDQIGGTHAATKASITFCSFMLILHCSNYRKTCGIT